MIFFFGTFAAIIAKTFGAPIERVKLIQQALYQKPYTDDHEILYNSEEEKEMLSMIKSLLKPFELALTISSYS